MATIRVRSSAGNYDVHFARGILAQARRLIASVGNSENLFVLSSPRVWKFWGRAAARALGVNAKSVILFDDRESAKRLTTVEEIARKLTRAGADRHCLLVAAGGGVVGDVAGFAAATYLRGVQIVHIPTTVVAQVDSAIGGKTGVDLPEGKNLVGAFYPPKLVIADPEMLRTLPQREYRSGLYEVIKYGIIADAKLFRFLETHMDAVLRRDAAALNWIIPRCIAIKARVVAADERESGLRKILNFGHTLGHALEAATAYRRFRHGEAVALGMMEAVCLAMASYRLHVGEGARILQVIGSVGPIPAIPPIPSPRLFSLLATDKKSRAGEARWVLPRKIGKVEWDIRLPRKLVGRVAEALPVIMREAQKEGGPIIGIRLPHKQRTPQ